MVTEMIDKQKLRCKIIKDIFRLGEDYRKHHEAKIEEEMRSLANTLCSIDNGEFDARPVRNCARCHHGVFPITAICKECTDTNNKWEPKEPMQNSDICDRAYLNRIFSATPHTCSIEKRVKFLEDSYREHLSEFINYKDRFALDIEKLKKGQSILTIESFAWRECTKDIGTLKNRVEQLEKQHVEDQIRYARELIEKWGKQK